MVQCIPVRPAAVVDAAVAVVVAAAAICADLSPSEMQVLSCENKHSIEMLRCGSVVVWSVSVSPVQD